MSEPPRVALVSRHWETGDQAGNPATGGQMLDILFRYHLDEHVAADVLSITRPAYQIIFASA